MNNHRHKVFISYHHGNDQQFKDDLLELNIRHEVFIDKSVDTGHIDENLSDQKIREEIRDEYLKDSTVTLLLVGTETRKRKHIDWEIYSSMYDGVVNKRSGILVINLPSITGLIHCTHEGEHDLYPDITKWRTLSSREEYEYVYPFIPERIVDNLCDKHNPPKISITNWRNIAANPEVLRWLISSTFQDRTKGEYCLSRLMKRANSIY